MSGPGHAMRVDRDAGLSALMAVVTVPVVGHALLRSGPEGFAEALALPLVLAFAAPRWAVYLAAGIAAAAVLMAAGYVMAGASAPCPPHGNDCWDERGFALGVEAFATFLGALTAALGGLARDVVRRRRPAKPAGGAGATKP